MTVEMKPLDPIEDSRTYTFTGGEQITLHKVTHLAVSSSGTHRLKTEDGKLHIIPKGWLHIMIDCAEWTF